MSPAREAPDTANLTVPITALQMIERLTGYPPCAVELAAKLMIACIEAGVSHIVATASELARSWGVSDDTLRVARRAMEKEGCLRVRGRQWWLPEACLPPLETMRIGFPPNPRASSAETLPLPFPPVEKSDYYNDHNPGAPGHKSRENQDSPGAPGQKTRENQDFSAKRGGSFAKLLARQETLARDEDFESEENQRYSASCGRGKPLVVPKVLAHQDRRIDIDSYLELPQSLRSAVTPSALENPSAVERVVRRVDSVDSVRFLPPVYISDAEELKTLLRDYASKYHPTKTVPDGPDEQILAQCLAAAPLARLIDVLTEMNRVRTKAGDKWPWWVKVFCHRIHRNKDPRTVRAPEIFRQQKQNSNPSYESAEAAQTQRQENETLLTMAAGRTRL